MGIGISVLGELGFLKKNGYIPAHPRLVEIGAQQLSRNFINVEEALSSLQATYGISAPFADLKPIGSVNEYGQPWNQSRDGQLARGFWEWLGFEYAAIDIDGSEKAIPLDLNFDEVPQQHIGQYDLVTNFGTTEHTINQYNAFKIIHELTAFGGIMLHNLPAQGMMNHGMFSYHPKFFWKLCRANGYRVISANFHSAAEVKTLPQNLLDHIAPYDPTILERALLTKMQDGFVAYILQKIYDIPFVPPIDIPMGSKTDNETLKARYWTVFEENAFAAYPRYESKAEKA